MIAPRNVSTSRILYLDLWLEIWERNSLTTSPVRLKSEWYGDDVTIKIQGSSNNNSCKPMLLFCTWIVHLSTMQISPLWSVPNPSRYQTNWAKRRAMVYSYIILNSTCFTLPPLIVTTVSIFQWLLPLSFVWWYFVSIIRGFQRALPSSITSFISYLENTSYK